jgi:hypothetical protein
MCFGGRENAVALTLGEDRLSDSVGGLSCLSCVRTKIHMSTRTMLSCDFPVEIVQKSSRDRSP